MNTVNELTNLMNIGQGAALEKWQDEFNKVLENIHDPNTKFDKTRKIILTVEFSPDKNRHYIATSIHADSKLAPYSEFNTTLATGIQNGTPVAAEIVQEKLFPEEKKERDKVTHIDDEFFQSHQ